MNSDMTTNGEADTALASLGFSTLDQSAFNKLRDDLMRSSSAKSQAFYQSTSSGRAVRACLLRDWFFEVYEVYKTPHSSDTDCSYYYRLRTPPLLPARGHEDDEFAERFLTEDGVVFKQSNYAEMKSLITKVHIAFFRNFTASADLSESVRTTLSSITGLIDRPDDRYIYIGLGRVIDRGETLPEDGVYKDDFSVIDLNKLCLEESGEVKVPIPRVFYKLFDTSPKDVNPSNDIVSVPQLTPELIDILTEEYETTLGWLNSSEDPNKRPRIPNKLHEIDEWACGFDDRYRDIIHMACARLKKHDYGIYFLTGLRRNGKSSCLDLMASLYGVNNICRVGVDDLGDHHNLHNFKRALVNLPDEQKLQNEQQKVMSSEAVKAFRISAAHSSDNMSVMRSNQSDIISYSFVTMAPVNRMPNFPSEEKAACLDRCRIIEFQADFSASDKLAVKWGKAHFTPTFMMRFAGQVLAYANYYSTHSWVMTSMMSVAQQKQYENSASNITYMKMWERVFCGFDSYNTLFTDYENYCKLMDVEKAEFGRNSILLVQYNMTGMRSDPLGGRYRYHYNKLLQEEQAESRKAKGDKSYDGPSIMYRRTVFTAKDPDNPGEVVKFTDGKTIEDFHNAGGSIIFELEDRGYFDKLDEQSEQLRLGGV